MAEITSQLSTALADRYAIQRELGRGGMATVYLAEQQHPKRQVAIKVLDPEIASILGPERFLREVDLAAKLTHPHILPLHSAGDADGLLYYVMPYVEGESLRDRLNREIQLPLDDALQIAREVADALSYAHSHDVVHRDIKPENILLSGGHAVVADFGIARAISAAGGETLTQTGVAIGTPAYMSPEQAAGSKELDGRSDLYSLGCVLYEMLGGQPPFVGPTVGSVVHQHLTTEPPAITTLRPAVPPEVTAVLTRVLAKTPADRFSPAAQFAEALVAADMAPRLGEAPPAAVPASERQKPRRRVVAYATIAIVALIGVYAVISRTGGPPGSVAAVQPPKLVVLPFTNLGSSKDEYFAGGITEEITSRIAEISGVRVISRQSAIQYKNSEKTLQQIGEELSVEYVLEGTIRTDRVSDGSGQVRVTPQLIRVSDDAHLWTNRYTANLVPGEIFGVQEQIANEVARALDVTLLEPERRRLAAKPTDNLEAYDYFLRGNDYYRRSEDEQDIRIAIQMYEKAVELDPDFALAYARLSRAHSGMWWYHFDRTQQRLLMAKGAADKALRLDPGLPEAHEALGLYHYWGHLDYDRALAEFDIAQQSQPRNSDLFAEMGFVKRRQGRFAEALADLQEATELDPHSKVVEDLAGTYFLLRNPVEALRYYDMAIASRPDWPGPYARKAWLIYIRSEGSTEKARTVLEEAQGVDIAEDPEIVHAWVLVDLLDGDYQEALDRLALVSSELLFEDQFLYVPKAQLYAQVYGLMGNRELERAYYDSARSTLEARIRERPDDGRYRSALGIAYAGLGRKADAIREGELAVELLPMSKEAWRGAIRLEDLARILTVVGEYDAAVEQLEILLSVPSPTAVPMLRIDPIWDPLREHPRFRQLLERGN